VWWLLAGGGLLLLMAAAGLWWVNGQNTPADVALPPTVSVTPTATAVTRPIGPTNYCRKIPQFVKDQGFGANVIFSTSDRTTKGLILFEATQEGVLLQKNYRDPTWDDAGYLGAVTIDQVGNLYVPPVPRVSLIDNPPEKQLTIYKVDAATGVMAEYLNVPAAAPPSQNNPFGLMAVTYDCDTQLLYAASLAGSTRTQELGRLTQIDATQAQVLHQYEGVDAIGLGVFNGAHGKRLYFGSARLPELRSIALDDQGAFVGAPRVEQSIQELGAEVDERVRRIVFTQQNEMILYTLKFNYNLAAASEREETIFRFTYEAASDRWTLVETSM
jgi:hypothetical protein